MCTERFCRTYKTEKMTMITGSVMKGICRVAMATASLMVVMLIVCKQSTTVRDSGKPRDILDANQYRSLRQHENGGSSFATLSVNTTTIINTVDERFISVGETMGSLNRPLGQNFNSTRYWTVARGLSPAIFRFGGAEADFTFFDVNSTSENCSVFQDNEGERNFQDYGKLHFFNMTLCPHTWNNINEFARSVGWDVLFCLNALSRNKTSFDPTNALQMLTYSQQRGYQVLWGLGNEPNGYSRKANVTVNGTQMAEAFHTLRKSVAQTPDLKDIFLVGPDTSAPKKKGQALKGTETYLNDFLRGIGNATNITSFHYYYTSGRTACFENMTDPHVADLLIPNIESVKQSVAEYGSAFNSKIWITESGLTFGGNPSGLRDNYITGMLILDKLGMSAHLGINLIVQQGLLGQNGGILDSTHKPRLPYWLLLYHKRLMGTRVLNVTKVVSTSTNTSRLKDPFDFTSYVRMYAHCTKTSTSYQRGSVTLMIINMIPINEVHIQLEEPLSNTTIHEYHFMPLGIQSILSHHGKLNGQRLKMDSDLTLPDYPPRKLPPGSIIVLPQQSYGFYVLPYAQAPACL